MTKNDLMNKIAELDFLMIYTPSFRNHLSTAKRNTVVRAYNEIKYIYKDLDKFIKEIEIDYDCYFEDVGKVISYKHKNIKSCLFEYEFNKLGEINKIKNHLKK